MAKSVNKEQVEMLMFGHYHYDRCIDDKKHAYTKRYIRYHSIKFFNDSFGADKPNGVEGNKTIETTSGIV